MDCRRIAILAVRLTQPASFIGEPHFVDSRTERKGSLKHGFLNRSLGEVVVAFRSLQHVLEAEKSAHQHGICLVLDGWA
jgi:hypothetical protein